MRFTALQDFFSEETRSQYVAGLSYTARTKELASLVMKWADEGKVKLGGGEAKIKGMS